MKLKITGTKPRIYTHVDYEEIPPGTVLKIIEGDGSMKDDIVMRTDEDKYPFITLVGGTTQADVGMLYGSLHEIYNVKLQELDFIIEE